jgi:hypothetical protein
MGNVNWLLDVCRIQIALLITDDSLSTTSQRRPSRRQPCMLSYVDARSFDGPAVASAIYNFMSRTNESGGDWCFIFDPPSMSLFPHILSATICSLWRANYVWNKQWDFDRRFGICWTRHCWCNSSSISHTIIIIYTLLIVFFSSTLDESGTEAGPSPFWPYV